MCVGFTVLVRCFQQNNLKRISLYTRLLFFSLFQESIYLADIAVVSAPLKSSKDRSKVRRWNRSTESLTKMSSLIGALRMSPWRCCYHATGLSLINIHVRFLLLTSRRQHPPNRPLILPPVIVSMSYWLPLSRRRWVSLWGWGCSVHVCGPLWSRRDVISSWVVVSHDCHCHAYIHSSPVVGTRNY